MLVQMLEVGEDPFIPLVILKKIKYVIMWRVTLRSTLFFVKKMRCISSKGQWYDLFVQISYHMHLGPHLINMCLRFCQYSRTIQCVSLICVNVLQIFGSYFAFESLLIRCVKNKPHSTQYELNMSRDTIMNTTKLLCDYLQNVYLIARCYIFSNLFGI